MDRTKHGALLKEMCQLYIKLKTQGLNLISYLENLDDAHHCEQFIIKTIYNWLLKIVNHEINEPILFDQLMESSTPRSTSSTKDPSLYEANYLASELGCSLKGSMGIQLLSRVRTLARRNYWEHLWDLEIEMCQSFFVELDPSIKQAFRLYIGYHIKRHNRYFRLIQAACFEARRLKRDYTINMSLESISNTMKNTFFIVILGVYNSLDNDHSLDQPRNSRLSIEIPQQPPVVGDAFKSISFRRNLPLDDSVSNWPSSELNPIIFPIASQIKRSYCSKDLFAIDQEIEMDALDQDITDDTDLVDQEYTMSEMQNIQVEFLNLEYTGICLMGNCN
jgi:hypothetical protein